MDDRGKATFWRELARRNVLRVGAAYAVASFAIIEVISNVVPMLDLPSWIGRAVIMLLILGFPAALAFSWVYELTPEGLKRTEEVEHNASVTHRTAHRLNVVTIVLVLLLAGLYGADRFLPGRETAASGNRGGSQDASISIAVLPFVNLSGDASQEFFSDGMTEEITSALAKVKGLKVVGRTSAFEFKGQNKDLHAIGQALRASYLLEGSLRKSGSRVRITGQLIRADDGTHIWTENYDRELADMFATQDDIARAIAAALQAPLGLKSGDTLVARSEISPESYQQFLRAKALVRARNTGSEADRSLAEPITFLEDVVSREPTFGPAWALLSQAYALGAINSAAAQTASEISIIAKNNLPAAEKAARRALELDSRSADAHAALAYILHVRGRHSEAEDAFKQAVDLDAFNPDILHLYSLFIATTGRVREAAEMRKKLYLLEPMVPQFNGNSTAILYAAGQAEAALAILKSPRTYAAVGRFKEAADLISKAPEGRYAPSEAETAIRLLLEAPQKAETENLPDLKALNFVYLYVGASERIFAFEENRVSGGLLGGPYHIVWEPPYSSIRKTERFKTYLRKAGYLDYWRARGWPDMCHPVGADDFECS